MTAERKRGEAGILLKINTFYSRNPITNNLICTQGERAAGIGFVLVARREFTHAKTQKKDERLEKSLASNICADKGTRTPTPLGIRS